MGRLPGALRPEPPPRPQGRGRDPRRHRRGEACASRPQARHQDPQALQLTEEDDVRKFVVRRSVTTKGGKTYSKAPKIQRLVTPRQLSRQRHRVALRRGRAEKNKKEQAAYMALVAQRAKEAKERRHELLMKRRSSHGSNHSASKA